MSRYTDGDETLGKPLPIGMTTEDGVVGDLSVKDLDSAFHSFRVKANFKLSPLEEVQREKLSKMLKITSYIGPQKIQIIKANRDDPPLVKMAKSV